MAIDVERLDRLERLDAGATSVPAPQEGVAPTTPVEREAKLPG